MEALEKDAARLKSIRVKAAKSTDADELVQVLAGLCAKAHSVTARALRKSTLGVEVNHPYIRRHESAEVREKSAALVERWKQLPGIRQSKAQTAAAGGSTSARAAEEDSWALARLPRLRQVASLAEVASPAKLKRARPSIPAASEEERAAKQPRWQEVPGILVTIISPSTVGQKGQRLPEVQKRLDGQDFLWKIVRVWAREALKLPESKLPGGVAGGAKDLDAKGVKVFGPGAKLLELTMRLCQVEGAKERCSRGVDLRVEWPPRALPKGWGVRPQPRAIQSECKKCGGSMSFRKIELEDGGFKTVVFCAEC